MKLFRFLVLATLFSSCLGFSLPLKTLAQNVISTGNFFMDQINKQQSEATPEIEALSGDAQSDLSATGERLKSAASAAEQNVEFEVGMDSTQASALTTMKTLLGDLKSKVGNVKTPTGNALSAGAESSLIAADQKLKYLVQDLESPGGLFVPKIPPEVTKNLAYAVTDYKAFRDLRPTKSEPPKQSNTAAQAMSILAGLPSASIVSANTAANKVATTTSSAAADQGGAGDDETTNKKPTRRAAPKKSDEVNRAMNRVNKNIRKAQLKNKQSSTIEVPMFRNKAADKSTDFEMLAKRMKSLESSLQSLPTMKQTQKREQDRIAARNTLLSSMEAAPVQVGAPSPSHDDIAATKVRLMTELVSNLDELGRFFGEDEVLDEDDNVAIIEDPKIALANANLAAAAGRLRGNAKAKPERFRDHTKLSDVRHYLGHPVAAPRAMPTETTDNLGYLRNLRNYVVSLRESENRA